MPWQRQLTKHNNTCYPQLFLFSVGFAVLTHPHCCWTDCFKQAWRLPTVAPHVYGGETSNYEDIIGARIVLKHFYLKPLTIWILKEERLIPVAVIQSRTLESTKIASITITAPDICKEIHKIFFLFQNIVRLSVRHKVVLRSQSSS